eukprot:CAMPEP_0171102206 /NCGR_PEP_ID=MMETSP0766_2-20121228/57159_1 /TAXON_ID=439317 /ORGANISM="Gambierdiscus australes, Strain CAWD 149" /LENGTH=120 /DNA_ID=CAMNT_0011562443 /DNA_START=63 /DNA_END=426 /DNA_ORIENTATION=+
MPGKCNALSRRTFHNWRAAIFDSDGRLRLAVNCKDFDEYLREALEEAGLAGSCTSSLSTVGRGSLGGCFRLRGRERCKYSPTYDQLDFLADEDGRFFCNELLDLIKDEVPNIRCRSLPSS